MKRVIIIVLSLAIILGFLFWRFGPNIGRETQTGPVTITYWGLWEEDNLIRPAIEEYKKIKPDITVNYVRQSSINYRTRVQTQIREGVGPDVFRIHNSWLPMFNGDLAPAPADVFTVNEYQTNFFPIATDSFVRENQIYAAPFGMDGLALFYNEDILIAGDVDVPRNWQEFINAATKLTVRDQSGQIQTAGAALGTAGNVDHWSDILGLLLLQQPRVNLTNPATPEVAEVFRFYTGFITDPRRKAWDVNLPNSTQAFAQGRLAFYFAPSWRAHELRILNPNLKFKVASVPQLSNRQVGWATFWGEAVSARSQNQKEAWEFVKFLTSVQTQKMLYAQASQVRLFGEPYSNVSLSSEIANDPIVGAFVTQGPYYKFWYLSSNTFDAGINEEMIKYWEDGINATLQGTDPQVALQTVAQGVQQVLQKYNQLPPATTQ